MIRLTLRQFRTQAWVAIGLLLVTAVLLGSTGPHLADLYDTFTKSQATCPASGPCFHPNVDIGKLDQFLELIGTALVAVPGLIGAFWGAPLITRELDHGTHQLIWTQSVTRIRWLTVKLTLIGAASLIATGTLSLMVTWWSIPIDHTRNRFGSGLFGERDVAPLGYAAFAFALGITLGLLIRRTLPAMATTLALFLGIRLAFTYLIRPHLIPPAHRNAAVRSVVQGFGQSNSGPQHLITGADIPNAWIYNVRIVDAAGATLRPQTVATSCPELQRPFSGPSALKTCVTKLGLEYHGFITYQPASRYWIFQSLETGIFFTASLALTAFCLWWIRAHAY